MSDDPIFTQALPANRLETGLQIQQGSNHMVIKQSIMPGEKPSISFSHDTREMREPGWEKEFAKQILNDPIVRQELELAGIKPMDVAKELNSKFKKGPDAEMMTRSISMKMEP